jgi:nucleotidyltransferase substrate binding protein (TIGR01987 family)
MKLNLTSLKKAIYQLEEAIKLSQSDLAKQNNVLALHLRAASIQAFEFTYELTFKMIRRYLDMTEPSFNVDSLTFNQIVRLAIERNITSLEVLDWNEFRRDRSITSHTYDQNKAEQVYASIPRFLNESKYVCDELDKRTMLD